MLTILDTPLGAPVTAPSPRSDRFAESLLEAVLPASRPAAARLTEPGALVVTTGQQPGLFTGPLYTTYKALSARALAATLERRWGRPVVPVFWVAQDDHDFAEAATTAWFGADGDLVIASLDPRPADAPLTPMGREPVPVKALELLDQLGAALPAGPAREATLDWLRRHYREGATLGGAFAGAMAERLTPLGIVCFDPTHPAARRAAAPVILEAIRRAAELDRLLVATSARLEAEDRAPDVKVGDGAALAFLDGGAGRDRLVPDLDGFKTRRGGERLSWADLERIARDEPERLSPNVLLRPVVESVLLPTVAYLAGPGELRYLGLAESLYQALGVTRQQPMPRWSGLLIEPRVARTLEKFTATIADLVAPGQLEERLLRTLAPPDFEPAFTDLRSTLEAAYRRIAAVAQAIDPTLEKPALSAKSGALSGAADLEKRLLGAQKRRQGELMAKIERIRSAIRPLGEPQERVLGVPALAGRYGFEFLTEVAEHVDAWYATALEGASTPA